MPNPKIHEAGVSTQFQPGESGNPAGRKPGLKSWSTLVKQTLADEALLEKLMAHAKGVPGWFKELEDKRMGYVIILAMSMKAMAGDSRAATWLRKTGYGDKLSLANDEERPIVPLGILDMNPPAPKPKGKKPTKRKAVNAKGNKPKAKPGLRGGSKPKGKKA